VINLDSVKRLGRPPVSFPYVSDRHAATCLHCVYILSPLHAQSVACVPSRGLALPDDLDDLPPPQAEIARDGILLQNAR